MNAKGLAFAPMVGGGGVAQGFVNGHVVLRTPEPCANVPDMGELRAKLRDAYPNVPHGTYVLYVTLHLPGMKLQRFAATTVRM